MRKVFVAMISAALIFGVQSQVMAQDVALTQEKETKKPVKLEELPEAVKQSLASDANKDFVAESATVINVEGKAIYEITGKRAGRAEVLLFAEDGTQVPR